MKASLIISVYKNVPFLKLVLDSLINQTEQDFEIIIAEDGENEDMRKFILEYPFKQPYQHISQEDIGWRKNRILNKAIRVSKSDWLIFIDGDCPMHERFIEMHLRYAETQFILAGKRVKLDDNLTDFLLKDSANLKLMQSNLKRKLILGKGGIRFIEDGIFISPDGLLSFIPKNRKNNKLLGCNMSFSKEAICDINGFDEDYILPAFGEDRDLSWRFEAMGYRHVSLRNQAIVYHLHHHVSWSDQEVNLSIYRKKRDNKEFVCKNGLIKK